ncbi:uncharacterized protein PV09_07232 [Verruconis gallopava]|uniref:Uncharacterized protein n=1 Tax=Verruconis gallopava TaxID=253628 RepID=A0A0D2A3T9_9PEZI|nr:uncharacterized protein PV09_07232 [Verruconis gallopava]KIW01478.1 hypothetical protein PV09_07232 [Verruconis gallopava]
MDLRQGNRAHFWLSFVTSAPASDDRRYRSPGRLQPTRSHSMLSPNLCISLHIKSLSMAKQKIQIPQSFLNCFSATPEASKTAKASRAIEVSTLAKRTHEMSASTRDERPAKRQKTTTTNTPPPGPEPEAKSKDEPWKEPPVVFTDKDGNAISEAEWSRIARDFEQLDGGILFSCGPRLPDHRDLHRFDHLSRVRSQDWMFDEAAFDKDFKEVFGWVPPPLPKKKRPKAATSAARPPSSVPADIELALNPTSEDSREARAARRALRRGWWFDADVERGGA